MAVRLNVEFEPGDVGARINALTKGWRRFAGVAEELADLVNQYARSEVPVDTGRLKESHHVEKMSEAEYLVAARTPYAVYVHEGTNPHDIFPVNAQALRFEVDGQVIFAQHVRHPGTEANPWMDRASERARQEAEALVIAAIEGAM